ncbi:hypothetical protein PL335_17180 (plasmid) [Sulfitobacter faviae]|uniref:hypothetical protein n=1 Tax=Sulfitobacter faviae TaxID=1775881 RepID=UPI0023074145|nr:hypothetical protein [Sulfitobacter faviae]WCE68578.1 hypothetical protein PL335_17180 [Sulfitobacter faviae]
MRMIRNIAFQLAVGSATFQGASFVIVLLAKYAFHAEGFAAFVTQVAWASILGAVATFRLEVILVQERQTVDRPVLLVPLSVAFMSLAIFGAVAFGISIPLGGNGPIEMMTLLLALGFALHEAQSFLCVRMERVLHLLATRAVQGFLIGATGLAAFLGWLSPTETFRAFALSVTCPLLIWWGIGFIRASGTTTFTLPDAKTWARGSFATVSSILNAAYVNVPILIAAATQNTALVADFGFLMKLLTGPLTLVRQAFGQTFLSKSLTIDSSHDGAQNRLMTLLLHTIKLALTSYGAILVLMVALVWIGDDVFSIHQPNMIFWLALATIPQAMINPVASIRTTLRRENTFFLYDTFRLLILTVALILPIGLAFHVTFSLVSSALYLLYWMFILQQIGQEFRSAR